ncbi:CCA-adding enzyme [Bienertia sinuspersici]
MQASAFNKTCSHQSILLPISSMLLKEDIWGSKNRELTTKDVETFARLWKVNNSDEAQDL